MVYPLTMKLLKITSLNIHEITQQCESKLTQKYIYTYTRDKQKLAMIMSGGWSDDNYGFPYPFLYFQMFYTVHIRI